MYLYIYMSTQYRAARNCDYNDLPDWATSIYTALKFWFNIK